MVSFHYISLDHPGEVVFAKQPRPGQFSVFVEMKFPPILPGDLETEVVRYEEEHYNRMRMELKAKEWVLHLL